MEYLSSDEEEQIRQALQQKEMRRKRAPKSAVKEKIVISPEEYQRRLIEQMKRDEQLTKMLHERRLNQSVTKWRAKVGERFRDANTDNPLIMKRVDRLQKGNTHGSSVVLSGDLGIGKTWLAYSYLNELVKRGIYNPAQIVASTESSILGRIASSGYKRGEMFDELKNPLHKIFFIDDVGLAHFSNDSARREVWYELIDHIYTNDLTLVLTTNKSIGVTNGRISQPKLLENWLGEAAYDRMKHIMGPEGLIVPTGVNKRPAIYKAREEKTSK